MVRLATSLCARYVALKPKAIVHTCFEAMWEFPISFHAWLTFCNLPLQLYVGYAAVKCQPYIPTSVLIIRHAVHESPQLLVLFNHLSGRSQPSSK